MKLVRTFCSCAPLVFCLVLLAAQAAQAVDFPGPVKNVALTSGNQSITVTWDPPDDDGGSPITRYIPENRESGYSKWYTVEVGGDTRSYTFVGSDNGWMQNGTTYDIRVAASNKWRRGSLEAATIVSIVAGLPAAPTGLTATAGDRQVTLSWTAGSNNGSALTKYQYQQNGGSWADIENSGASTTSHTVTGLTNGTAYTFKVRAGNTHGDGAASAAATATPATTPDAPTNLSATDTNQASGAVKLSWTAPTNNGGSAITGYKYSKDNGTNWTATGATTTSHTVTGLTNGTQYTFKVLAVNTHGDGAESGHATATPATTPAAPTNLSAADTAKVSGGEVQLTWTAPTSTGGAPITGYDYTTDDGTTWTSAGTASPYTVTNLTNGTAYTFKVRAVNRKGSTASNEATATPAATPLAPGSLSAALPTGQAKAVTLSWTTPNNRGAAIESYNYRQNGGGWILIQGSGATTTSHTVTGLNNGTQYSFEVRAKNRKGNSAIAGPVTATTPNTPAAPTNLRATDGNEQVALSWTAPTNDGGLAITHYEYSKDNGTNWTGTGTNTSATVTGLTNGTEYTFQVRAVNAAGDGAVATVKATPAKKPDAPTLTTPIIAGNKQVRLRWTAGSDNGAPITGYDYSKDDGTSWTDTGSTGTSYLVTGLENGTAYTFQVRAVNRKGETASAGVAATPRNFTATGGNQAVTLNWSALQTTATIATWQYQQNGGTWTAIQGSTTNTRSYTVTGLENGTEYTFQVRALNSGNTPVEHIEFPAATPRQPPSTNRTGVGGGATAAAADQHGDTPATATAIAAGSSTPGQMNSPADVDYFSINVPQAGLLAVETLGSVDTYGTLTTPEGTVLAEADGGGTRQNFQVTRRVSAGTYLVVVTGRETGSYRLEVDLLVGFVDNPKPNSAQSGLGVLSGWVCEAETVEIELDGVPQQAAYGTERADTVDHCGDMDNGFGLLWNWNLVGDGPHTVRVVVDGIVFATLPVTVTTLGLDDEFPTGLTGETTLVDFPTEGERIRLVWQESQQNFALAEGPVTRQGGTQDPTWATLENPAPGSYQSGISVLSGWVCEGEEVVLEIDGVHRLAAAYPTDRADTVAHCGDTDNGFGVLWNWNLSGPGPHTIRLLVDEAEWATATFTVTTLGAEMRWGLAHTATVADFPGSGQAVTVAWQEGQQNFVITGVEE